VLTTGSGQQVPKACADEQPRAGVPAPVGAASRAAVLNGTSIAKDMGINQLTVISGTNSVVSCADTTQV
jgi:hypothetical protein